MNNVYLLAVGVGKLITIKLLTKYLDKYKIQGMKSIFIDFVCSIFELQKGAQKEYLSTQHVCWLGLIMTGEAIDSPDKMRSHSN